jgi:hypothetical protein
MPVVHWRASASVFIHRFENCIAISFGERVVQDGGSSNSQGGPRMDEKFAVTAPSITLPKGGGAISGIGEKFSANPVTGTGSMTVPIFTSPGRSGFGPQLALSYESGAGNGPFGFGWNLSTPSISRKTDRGLPKYVDAVESDTFILSGAEDLVPVLTKSAKGWEKEVFDAPGGQSGYVVHRYRPRIEGLFARIERWVDKASGVTHWRSISKDNITTLYGKGDDARIADPADPTRVFKWLISESYDDKGNAILYRYKAEDDANVDRAAPCERNRLISKQFPQRYQKSICYANRTPRTADEDLALRKDWLLEVVFDYGEHDAAAPTTKEIRSWPSRLDPFSLFRQTFDVRSYRLCRRVLMFHHFPDELDGVADYLVRSTDFDYKEGPVASFIVSITQAGYARQPDGSYFRKALPKLEFKYTEVQVDETVREIDPTNIENLPQGVDGARFQWIDLDSEGLTGILTEEADAWFYKRNLGNGTFGPLEQVALTPSIKALGSGQQQLLDVAGEGRLDLVQYDGPMPGFQARNGDGGWGPFTPFKSLPSVNTKDPNVRFLDVTGNGHPDLLISEDAVFTWYESLGKDGFAPARSAPKSWDEEKGAKLVFADSTQSIFTADMLGDGLSDIVRVRRGDICYWPNLGYGRFGAKVTMGAAPVFDRPDLFDPRRVHFADIDGSGNSDIIYVGVGGVSLYFNQSGNSWSPERRLASFPRGDSLTSIAPMDLLGNGTACLVWSSPLGSNSRRPMRYIDLMGGQKPHLLIHTTNNMGAETSVQYAASTKFYLRDRAEGRPWVTRLAFPVHVIERVENRDLVSNTMLVTSYRYRHGYFDGVEREFRGFAYVEQRDAESLTGAFDLPPIVTKTWFHNGALLEEGPLEAYFKSPANREFFDGDPEAGFLPDPEFPPNLDSDELREAARALKGSVLRQEIYADDGTPKAALPYSVSERNYRLTCLQPLGPNRHSVFFSHPSETIDFHYERNPADPRASHALTLAVDDYGNVLKSAAVGYARRAPAFDEQKVCLATLTENAYTNAILEDQAYRTPLLAEVKTYELTAPALAGAKPLDFQAVASIAAAASEIAYETQPTSGQTQKRLIEQTRTLYRKDDLSALLPIGIVQSMALPGESYRLSLTPGLLDIFRAQASRSELAAVLTTEGGYRELDGDGRLWIPSGRAFYSPIVGNPPPQELNFARAHFFLSHRFQDPFGNSAVVAYDAKYAMLLVSTRDAVGNTTSAEHDYRVLQPRLVTDPNDNRTEARFDALGMLAGTAVRGKAAGPVEGDSFDAFVSDLSPPQVKEFFGATDPRALAIANLGTATIRILYDLERVPVCAAAIARETHVSDLAPGAQTKVQLHFVYSDGFGREAQTKVRAEPGPLDLSDPKSPVADPRWVGAGEKVYNTKGKPIRQYEPFFSATPQFSVEKWGVTSTMFYDSLERVVATLHPNNTFEKVVFDPWRQISFDVNDTVTFNPKTDPDVGDFFGRLPDADYSPTWYRQRIDGAKGPEERTAAEKAAKHTDTPSVVHFDSLGRVFLTIADNGKDASGADQKYATRTVLDIEGQQREMVDALGRVVMRLDYAMHGTKLHQASMEAGERWTLDDVKGKPIRAWNNRKYVFRTEYDVLRRPLKSFVKGGDHSERNPTVLAHDLLFERTIYGDNADTALTNMQQKQANLKNRIFQQFDGAGVVTTDLYDFKGNSLRGTRQFTSDYKNPPDWSQYQAMEPEIFASATAYDALNRAITVTSPDKSIYRPTFNEANLLERVDVDLRGASPSTSFVSNVDYNAKGQRTLIQYGNGASTTYVYDEKTFRVTNLKTTRIPHANGLAVQIFVDSATVQDISYFYDPVGNITCIRDAALLSIFNANQQVDPTSDYTYDPIYRLTEATGREHVGQSGFQLIPPDGKYRDYPFASLSQLNNPQTPEARAGGDRLDH